MPTVTTQRRDECAFPDCHEEFGVRNAVAGSYCSRECADRHRGRKLLRDLRHDHRVCGSCFRLRKTVETPPDEYRRRFSLIQDEAVTGFQQATKHAEMGDHGLECVCGSVDHAAEWSVVREGPACEAWEWWLATATRHLVAEGQREDAVDAADVADAYHDTGDLELAVGRCLTDSN